MVPGRISQQPDGGDFSADAVPVRACVGVGRGIRRPHRGRDCSRGDLKRITGSEPVQIVCPSLHRWPAFRQEHRSIVRPPVRITHRMGQLMFDDVRPKTQHLVMIITIITTKPRLRTRWDPHSKGTPQGRGACPSGSRRSSGASSPPAARWLGSAGHELWVPDRVS